MKITKVLILVAWGGMVTAEHLLVIQELVALVCPQHPDAC